jgi:hypothetical protein
MAETLKMIKQKPDERLWDYVKCFCNAKNTIPNKLVIEIINAFRDGVSDIKTIKEIAMKKPKLVVDLLAVTDICIEASEAYARFLDSWNKGPSKKKQQEDRDVNTADRRDRGNRQQQPAEQKEKRPFHRPTDVEKWCEIHQAAGHDLEECKTFLNHRKMPEKPVA